MNLRTGRADAPPRAYLRTVHIDFIIEGVGLVQLPEGGGQVKNRLYALHTLLEHLPVRHRLGEDLGPLGPKVIAMKSLLVIQGDYRMPSTRSRLTRAVPVKPVPPVTSTRISVSTRDWQQVPDLGKSDLSVNRARRPG